MCQRFQSVAFKFPETHHISQINHPEQFIVLLNCNTTLYHCTIKFVDHSLHCGFNRHLLSRLSLGHAMCGARDVGIHPCLGVTLQEGVELKGQLQERLQE